MFYLTLCLLSWENSILSCTRVSRKPPQNTKKREGPAFVLNDSVFLCDADVAKLSSTVTGYFHCSRAPVLRDCLRCIQGLGECTVQPSVLNKEQQKTHTSTQRAPSRALIQTKQVQARKPAGNQGRRTEIRLFGCARCKGSAMLFVMDFDE